MKGMLTGPVTILQWSFVRDDQPRPRVCRQIALAIRDEVIGPGSRRHRGSSRSTKRRCAKGCRCARPTGKPISTGRWNASGSPPPASRDETQIHTHMCYSEFNDIIDAIGAMDADVISIETSRSKMELLDAFVDYRYPNEIGPGVYDIHSPRVPERRGDDRVARQSHEASEGRPALGQSGLRAQDPEMGRGEAGAGQHGGGGATIAVDHGRGGAMSAHHAKGAGSTRLVGIVFPRRPATSPRR